MARATATAMADGNATETAAAMVLDNRKSIWPAATAMGGGDGNGDGVCNGDGDGDGNCNGDSHGKSNNDKGRVASSCASNVQRCGRVHPHGHKGVCIHQRCVMGVRCKECLLPFKGEGS